MRDKVQYPALTSEPPISDSTETTQCSPSRQGSLKRIGGSVPSWLCALAIYLPLALVTIGWHAVSHFSSVCACEGIEDPASYMWALSWWPHAIAHGLNPFVTHYLWSPTGVNVAQGAMIPTAAIVMAPVTELAGPVVSYNILSIASPILAAFTAYLLCRRLVHRELPAIVGGYLFGFSSYEFAQLTTHPNLTLIFLIPLFVLVALRRVDRAMSRRAYVIIMAFLFILQAGLSTELLAECVGFGAILLVSARFLAPEPHRSRVNDLISESASAGLIALILASPFFYYALFSGGFPEGIPGLSDVYALDFLNPIFPTGATWLGHNDFLSLSRTYAGGGVIGADGYLSAPLIVAFLVWVLGRERRTILARLLMIATLASFMAALGSHLFVAGHQTVTLPFNWVRHLPIFNNILPSRIALFTTLAISIGVAAWLAMTARRAAGRWLVVLLGIVMIFPNLTTNLYGGSPRNPRFFSTTMYRRYLARGESVLVLPFAYNDLSMLWQAESGFYFYMPEGYTSQVVPYPFSGQSTVTQLLSNTPASALAFESFIREHYVGHIIVDTADVGTLIPGGQGAEQSPWPSFLASVGLRGQQVGGVLLYAVPDAWR
jgi:hypothetical protein